MKRLLNTAVLVCGLGGTCWGARCTTVLDPRILSEYDKYVAAAEQAMSGRFDSGELAWVPSDGSKEAAARLASGRLVRRNISDAAVNRRIAGKDGTIIDWVGAIRIRGASTADLRSVLEHYDDYNRIYRPMVFECRAKRNASATDVYDLILGLQSTFRFASVFLQHYAFQVKAHADYSGMNGPHGPGLSVHLRASEIRESDSGVPGRSDFLEPYHDHGIMWALNAYWRARQRGSDLYLEFETITLARSSEAFACKIGFVPVPRSIVAAAMDSLPADSVATILEGTRTECERRAPRPPVNVFGQ